MLCHPAAVTARNLAIIFIMKLRKKFLKIFRPKPDPQPDRKRSPCALQHCEIPDFIFRVIVQHLGETPLVCFAIACPEFHDQYFPLSITKQRRIKVLLEEHPLSGYRCRGCHADHPLQSYWFGAQFFTCNDFYGRHLSTRYFQMRAFDFSLSVPQEIARRIMHHHVNGYAHDFPVEQLVPSRPLIARHLGVIYIRSWDARFIDDRLVLYSYTTLTFENNPRGAGQYIDMGLVSICRHVNTGRLLLANQNPPQENYYSRRHGSIMSCPICNTDYSVDIIWNEGHWVLGISSYHILEIVRPRAWTWDVMSYCPEEARTSPRSRKLLGPPQGIAMHMWYKQDAMALDCRPEGDWAVQPAYHRDPYYVNRPVLLF